MLRGNGYYGGAITPEKLSTFFDWLKPIFKKGYESLQMKGGAIPEYDIRIFCRKGAQQAWTLEDFDKGMAWFMWNEVSQGILNLNSTHLLDILLTLSQMQI